MQLGHLHASAPSAPRTPRVFQAGSLGANAILIGEIERYLLHGKDEAFSWMWTDVSSEPRPRWILGAALF